MTRLEAAERAVAEAAMAWVTAWKYEGSHAAWDALLDACARLRDLRKKHAEEECGANDPCFIGPFDRVKNGLLQEEDAHTAVVRCRLPRGHAGAHEGDLGVWRWE